MAESPKTTNKKKNFKQTKLGQPLLKTTTNNCILPEKATGIWTISYNKSPV